MNNSTDNGPLHVPGFDDVPLRFELPPGERCAHGASDWVQEPRPTAREIAMLHFMNVVTDTPEWYSILSDHDQVARWRQEGLAWLEEGLTTPLISDRTWDWCLAELQDKADPSVQQSKRRSITVWTWRCSQISGIVEDGRAIDDQVHRATIDHTQAVKESDVVLPVCSPPKGKSRSCVAEALSLLAIRFTGA